MTATESKCPDCGDKQMVPDPSDPTGQTPMPCRTCWHAPGDTEGQGERLHGPGGDMEQRMRDCGLNTRQIRYCLEAPASPVDAGESGTQVELTRLKDGLDKAMDAIAGDVGPVVNKRWVLNLLRSLLNTKEGDA